LPNLTKKNVLGKNKLPKLRVYEWSKKNRLNFLIKYPRWKIVGNFNYDKRWEIL